MAINDKAQIDSYIYVKTDLIGNLLSDKSNIKTGEQF